MSKKKKDGFADLAAAFAKVYSTENAAEVFDGSYEDQVRNPAFIGMMLYNCMVMNALYGCRRGGCAGCRARDLFDRVEDPATKWKLRFALRNIEGLAIAALANQPHDDDECGRHLNKALAGIERAAHVARCGRMTEGDAAAPRRD